MHLDRELEEDVPGKMHLKEALVKKNVIIPDIVLDHDDPSKPSHRLTNGPKPSKTIESDGSKTKNH